MSTQRLRRRFAARAILACLTAAVVTATTTCMAQVAGPQPIVHRVDSPNQRLEMIANSSRILTLDQKIPQAQVNNPEVLEVTPLSPTKVQIFAKNPGVTQVNLWDENDNIHSIDVIVYGDARELSMLLNTQFPKASLKVIPLANSVVISGFVDDPDAMERIVEIAEDYHPRVINNIRIGGVQQVLLHTKVMEVSRTKLRQLGVDFSQFNGDDFVSSGISGIVTGGGTTTGSGPGNLLSAFGTATGTVSTQSGTLQFGIVTGNNAFNGFLSALKQNNLMKVLAEPDLVTVSGRPATFNVGGEFPILVPQSLGTVSIEFKKFGTQMDFVPLVQGNERIRLEIRPRVSEIDETRSVQIGDINVPGLRVREVNTGVEMRAGQTLALAGLVQTRVEAEVRGLPWVSDLPYVGAAFRRTTEEKNEIELLIMVTPYLVDAMDCEEVPEGGPGTMTCSPDDCQLHCKGKLEVPCGGDCPGCSNCHPGGSGIITSEEVILDSRPIGNSMEYGPQELPPVEPQSSSPPTTMLQRGRMPARRVSTDAGASNTTQRTRRIPAHSRSLRRTSNVPGGPQNASQHHNPTPPSIPEPTATAPGQPGLVGPIGYDVDN